MAHFPKCFDNYSQYRGWMWMRKQCYDHKATVCTDCTPEYKAQMLIERRCIHPDTMFRIDKDGMIEGWRK